MGNHRKLLPAVADLSAWCLLFLPAILFRPSGVVDLASVPVLLSQCAALAPQVAALFLWSRSKWRKGFFPPGNAGAGSGDGARGHVPVMPSVPVAGHARKGGARAALVAARFLLLLAALVAAALAGDFAWRAAGQAPNPGFSFDPAAAAIVGGGKAGGGALRLRILLPISFSALLLMLLTALREELFFRVCLLDDLSVAGFPPFAALFAGSILFCLPHAWEGGSAVIAAFLMSLALGAAWSRWRSAGLLVSAHFAYNCGVLLLAALFPGIG